MSRMLENEEGGDRELEPKVGEIYLRGFKAKAPSAGSSSSRLHTGYIDGQIWRGEIGPHLTRLVDLDITICLGSI